MTLNPAAGLKILYLHEYVQKPIIKSKERYSISNGVGVD